MLTYYNTSSETLYVLPIYICMNN